MSRRLAVLVAVLIVTSAGCRASATAGGARDAAADPEEPVSTAPTPKPASWSKDKACEQDSDCMLLPPAPCECPPCGEVLRKAVNRKTGERRTRAWEQEDHDCSLRAVPCAACTGKLIGSEAICAERQCVAVP